MQIIGWFGSILLAFCGLPAAIDCAIKGHARGLNWFFLIMWFGGELLTVIYVAEKLDWPLLFNYSANIAFLLVILKYKIWPRESLYYPEKSLLRIP